VLSLVQDDDHETPDLLTKTTGAKAALTHQQKVDRLTHMSVKAQQTSGDVGKLVTIGAIADMAQLGRKRTI